MTREDVYISLVIAGSSVLQLQRDPLLRAREDGARIFDEKTKTVLFSGPIAAVIAWLEGRAERGAERRGQKIAH